MREFILLSLKGSTGRFSISDKTESGLVCRTIASTFWASRGLRRDTQLWVVLNGPPHSPRIISFKGEDITSLGFDDRGLAELVNMALAQARGLSLHEWIDAAAGIRVGKESFEWLVRERINRGFSPYYLHRKGSDIRTTPLEENATFIFGDLFGIPKNTEKLLKHLGASRLSLGPTTLLASHCPILVHNEIDRRSQAAR